MKLDVEEALRYLGAGNGADELLRAQVARMADKLTAVLQPRCVYRVFSLSHSEQAVCMPECGLTLAGRTVNTLLAHCTQAALLACTLGAEFDAMLRAAQARNMAQAVILDACGSAWVESGCNVAEQELAARFPGKFLTDRFSPGYGDLPLTLQPDICRTLDTEKHVGIYVSDSCLMNPSKSVTAVIGLADEPQMARIRGCAYCAMRKTCALRKGGQHCGL